MSYFKPLLAASAAAALLAGTAVAQGPTTTAQDYSMNWRSNALAPAVGFSGPGLFGLYTGTTNYAGIGDSIRRCYGVDEGFGGQASTNLGNNHHWFKFAQGWAANNSIPGVDVGIVSVQAGSDSDIFMDNCLSPWFSSSGNSGGHTLSAAALLGLQTGTAGTAFPGVWESAFRWTTTSLNVASTKGDFTAIGPTGALWPALTNVIYEVQGPINEGPANNQYYLATTSEATGNNGATPGTGGGVANQNGFYGSSLYAADANSSNAVSHSRVTAYDTQVASFVLGTPPTLGGVTGLIELNGHVAFRRPVLWATNDGDDGAGAMDWRVGTAPVSVINLRVVDHRSGGERTTAVGTGKSTVLGPAAAGFDPTLVLQLTFFFWSATPSTGHPQAPHSWDFTGTIPGGAGLVPTTRHGLQFLSVNPDPIFSALLGVAALSVGGGFSSSDDVFLDGTVVDAGGSHSSLWEDMFDPVISGVSTLGFTGPILSAPDGSLVGVGLGLHAAIIQVRAPLFIPAVAEMTSTVTVSFQ